MIADTVQNAKQYSCLGPRYEKALCFLAQALEQDLPDGRYEVDGEAVFASISSYQTKPAEQCRFEAHRQYADIQCVMTGGERIDTASGAQAKIAEGSFDSGDIVFFEEKTALCRTQLERGDFVILFPGELHKPCISLLNNRCFVKKVVIKVREDG